MADDGWRAGQGLANQFDFGLPVDSPGPPPREGQDVQFDRYFRHQFGVDITDEVTRNELRKAAWATWKTAAPTSRNPPTVDRASEDEDLARAIALSTQEHGRIVASQDGPAQAIDLTGDEDDDEDLQRALKMSVEGERETKRPKREYTPEEERRALAQAMKESMAGDEVVEEARSSDDERNAQSNAAFQASRQAFREDELRRRQQNEPSNNSVDVEIASASSSNATARGAMTATASINGLGDRAQMERERIARQEAKLAQGINGGLAKAPQASSSSSTSRVIGLSDLPTSDGPSSSRPTNGSTNGNRPSTKPPRLHPLQSAGPFPRDAAGEYYLDGEMRNTHLEIGDPTSDPTFAPQDMMGKKDQISLIIMSSFVINEDWLETILPSAAKVPRIMIRPHPKDKHDEYNGKVQVQGTGEVRSYPHLVGAFGSAHMKFAWIFYKTGRLRVCILTANMVPYDWEDIENIVFIQDFLPSSNPPAEDRHKIPDFPARFRWLFVHLKVHKALRFLINEHPLGSSIPFSPTEGFIDLDQFDWTRVRVKIVMSVPGTYTGADKMEDFGLCRIGKILDDEGWKPKTGEIVKPEFQSSSLGAYSLDWFDQFYQYCSGKTTKALLNRPKADVWPPIKVLFPSLATVDASVWGRPGGGTMFCGKAMNAVTRPLFYDSNSKRGGVLMHAKVLIAMFEPRPNHLGLQASAEGSSSSKRKADEIAETDEGIGGWAYVGSHNFSIAAWGRANLKKSPPTLTINNHELGLMFPIPRKNASAVADAIAPFQRPPRKYSATDVPWDQSLMPPPDESSL